MTTEEKIDDLVSAVGVLTTNVALLHSSSGRQEDTLKRLEQRLYNGGKGDITKILRRVTRLERTKTLFSATILVLGGIGSFSGFALVVIEISIKLGWLVTKAH